MGERQFPLAYASVDEKAIGGREASLVYTNRDWLACQVIFSVSRYGRTHSSTAEIPPGKPAGFVYNNEAVRPAVGPRLNVDSSDCRVRPNEVRAFLAIPPRALRHPVRFSLAKNLAFLPHKTTGDVSQAAGKAETATLSLPLTELRANFRNRHLVLRLCGSSLSMPAAVRAMIRASRRRCGRRQTTSRPWNRLPPAATIDSGG